MPYSKIILKVLFIAILKPPPIGIENCVRAYFFLSWKAVVPWPSVPSACNATHSPLLASACGLKRKRETPAKIKGVKEIMYPGQNKYKRFRMNSKMEINISEVVKKDLRILRN